MQCARIIVNANNRIRKPKTYKKRYIIYTYPVANVPQIKKTMLQRSLKGYKVTRKTKRKVYKSEKTGLPKMLEAKKLGKAVIMVPQKELENNRKTIHPTRHKAHKNESLMLTSQHHSAYE